MGGHEVPVTDLGFHRAHLSSRDLGDAAPDVLVEPRRQGPQLPGPRQTQPVQVRQSAVGAVEHVGNGQEGVAGLSQTWQERRQPAPELLVSSLDLEHPGHEMGLAQPGGEEVVAAGLPLHRVVAVGVEEAVGVLDDRGDDVGAPQNSCRVQAQPDAEGRVVVGAGAYWHGEGWQPGQEVLEHLLRDDPGGLGPTCCLRKCAHFR